MAIPLIAQRIYYFHYQPMGHNPQQRTQKKANPRGGERIGSGNLPRPDLPGNPQPHRRGAGKSAARTAVAPPPSHENELESLRCEVMELHKERDASRAVLTSLEDKNKELQDRLTVNRSGNTSRPTHLATKKKLIPRPKGSGWCLQEKMRLSDDPVKYDRIIRALKALKKEAGFRDGFLCNDQSKDKVVKFCKMARKQIAYLRHFKHDWVTMAYLRRSMANRRAYVKTRGNLDKNGTEPSGDDADDDAFYDEGLGREDDEGEFAIKGDEDDDGMEGD